MRLRSFARRKLIVPARAPSTSITNTPNASGSASERSISSSSASRVFGRTAARKGSTSSWVTSSTRKSTSSRRARRIVTSLIGRSGADGSATTRHPPLPECPA